MNIIIGQGETTV